MAWDFETDPEYQELLDWADEFVREEVEPLDSSLGNPYDKSDPRVIELIRPLQQQVRDHGLWACHLGPELGGPGYGQVKLALLNEILGRSSLGADDLRLPGARLGQRRDPRPLRHRGAEGEVPPAVARRRDLVVLLDDRAARRRRPHAVHHAGRPRRRRVGHQRREVVLVQRPVRRVPHRDGRDQPRRQRLPGHVDVHRPGRHARREHHPQRRHRHRARGGGHATPTSATRTCASLPTTCSAARAGVRDRPDPARRRAHPPRHAHDRHRAAGLRHDVRAGAGPADPDWPAGVAADDPGEDRRQLDRDRAVPPARAAHRVADRQAQRLQAGAQGHLGHQGGDAEGALRRRRSGRCTCTARSASPTRCRSRSGW